MGNKIFMYFERIGIALSVLLNVITGGYSNQTLSARMYGRKRDGKWNIVCIIDYMFYVLFDQEDHCMMSWTYWRCRKHYGWKNESK